MNALTCEMCGSTEIVRKDGLYVCQACGTKYSVEDAKKMMAGDKVKVEGTVKVDASDELSNLTVLAHRATEANDWDRAYVYYEKILLINPDDWESNHNVQFYKAFIAHQQNLFTELSTRLDVFQRSIPSLNSMLAKKFTSEQWFKEIPDVWNPVVTNCNSLWNDHVARISKNLGLTMNEAKQKAQAMTLEIIQRNMPAIVYFLTELICNVDTTFGAPTQTWVIANAKSTIDLANRTQKCDPSVVQRLISLIKKYESDYVAPKKQGCYIATAVYGSYDCSEVWTLRRFRDKTLKKSWYGRAFISSYYAISPSLVNWFGDSKWFKRLLQAPLNHLVSRLREEGVEDTPYNDNF